MARRASGKRKRGRCSMNARRMARGEAVSTKVSKGVTGQHAKREERRLEERERRRDALADAPQRQSGTAALDKAPHSFVFYRGRVEKPVGRLVADVRRMLEPFTATRLKVRRSNNLKDFIVNAGPLGVSHLLVFGATKLAVNLRLVRVPHGPTLTFRVCEYVLAKDVVSGQKRPVNFQQQFAHQPLLVLNNFDSSVAHEKLTQSMFQGLFPSLSLDSVDLGKVRRCVMLNLSEESGLIEMRQYAIKTVPTGVTKSTKKLLQSKIPNLGRYEDISEFFLDPGQLSESDVEPEQVELTAPQDLKPRGCKAGAPTSVRLVEIGPRLSLRLLKVEEGVCDGAVLHHALVQPTPEQLRLQESRLSRRKAKRDRRVRAEEARVIRQMRDRAQRAQWKAAAPEQEQQQKLDEDGEGELLGRRKFEFSADGSEFVEKEAQSTDEDAQGSDDGRKRSKKKRRRKNTKAASSAAGEKANNTEEAGGNDGNER